MRISDAFLDKTEYPVVELEAEVISGNLLLGRKLPLDCRLMYEYFQTGRDRTGCQEKVTGG